MTALDSDWAAPFDAFLRSNRARGHSERTLEGRIASLRCFARWCRWYGHKGPGTVTATDIECYAADIARLGPDARPLAAGTRRNRLTAVRLFFRWWARLDQARSNPCAELELPRAPRTLPHRGFDSRALRALRDACDGCRRTSRRDRALVEFLVATGVRRGECCSLDVGDVDLLTRWVRVRHGKGGRSRVIPMNEIAVRWLRTYLRSRGSASPTEPLFMTPTKRRYSPGRMTDLVRRLLVRAGITGRGACHRFRHTLATTMLENGADIRHIQAMLGHADISTTMIYASVLPLALRAVYDRTHPGVKRRRWTKRSFT